jgi:hypothetical protein
MKNTKETPNKKYLSGSSNSNGKEDNMNKRTLLIILALVVLVAVGVLAVQVIKTESAQATSTMDAATEERRLGSDNILLHPPVPLPDNCYTGSDWIERHPCTPEP